MLETSRRIVFYSRVMLIFLTVVDTGNIPMKSEPSKILRQICPCCAEYPENSPGQKKKKATKTTLIVEKLQITSSSKCKNMTTGHGED